MITEERIASYICSLEGPEDPVLQSIRENALRDGVPIVRKETEALLSFFADLLQPLNILEVGCAVGYSAILMNQHQPPEGRLDTIENYAPRIPLARENFARAGCEDRIRLFEGDAGEVLKTLDGPYDLIFMDAAKGQYIVWLPEVLRLLSPRGVLISDNVLQDGDVLESRYAVIRRNRTIHTRMRAYLRELKHREDLSTMVLPLGDGVAVTTRKPGKTRIIHQEQL